MKIIQINQIKAALLDHFELDDYLTGKKTKTIVLATEKGKYTFDFEKNEFTQSEAIPSPTRRN